MIYAQFKEYRQNINSDPEIMSKYISYDYDVYLSKVLEDENNIMFMDHYGDREKVLRGLKYFATSKNEIRTVFNYDINCIDDKTLNLVMYVDTYLKSNKTAKAVIRYTLSSGIWKIVGINYDLRFHDGNADRPIDIFQNQ